MSKEAQFKQISDAMRKALRALGETPEDHDRERRTLATIANTTTSKATPVKSVAELNRAVVQRRGMSPEARRDEALRLEAAAQRVKPEIPDSWVIFLGEVECACGAYFTNLDFSTHFLRMRRVISTSPLRLDLSSARYIPADSEEASSRSSGLRLGKVIERNPHKVTTCQHCFAHVDPSSLVKNTESSQLGTGTPSEPLESPTSEEPSSLLSPPNTFTFTAATAPSGIEGVSWQERVMWERSHTPLDSSYASI